MGRPTTGQPVEADGARQAEALLSGDDLEAGFGQLGQVVWRRLTTFANAEQSHEPEPDQASPTLPSSSRFPPENSRQTVGRQKWMAPDDVEQGPLCGRQ
jgi:hypothetical protein